MSEAKVAVFYEFSGLSDFANGRRIDLNNIVLAALQFISRRLCRLPYPSYLFLFLVIIVVVPGVS